MNADRLLKLAVLQGSLVRAEKVGRESHPDAARTYLADGTGVAWDVPASLRGRAMFVVDAEVPAPVRQSLLRYGESDPAEFAVSWTRAEVWAKLFDVPIITWLSKHGLQEPVCVGEARRNGSIAWLTRHDKDMVITFGARNAGVVGGEV